MKISIRKAVRTVDLASGAEVTTTDTSKVKIHDGTETLSIGTDNSALVSTTDTSKVKIHDGTETLSIGTDNSALVSTTDTSKVKIHDGTETLSIGTDNSALVSTTDTSKIKLHDGTDTMLITSEGNAQVEDRYHIRDTITHATPSLTISHNMCHEGKRFHVINYQTFANSQVVDFTFITPNTTTHTHMTFYLSGEAALSIAVHEGATVDVPGTTVTAYNNNRNSAAASVNTIRTGDTFTGTGTVIAAFYAGGDRAIGIIDNTQEMILKQNTTYIFRITNRTVSNNIISYAAEWYETASLG